ncbi:regulatory protein RecX [bacterium]|nr:regulatory protein RecX [bacterium]
MAESSKLFSEALKKAADLLARRNHSEKELREKLSSFYDRDLIDQVVSEAQRKQWLLSPKELAEQAAKTWARANKSAKYIEEQLTRRGLAPVGWLEEDEINKIRTLLAKKFKLSEDDIIDLDEKVRVKAYRFLMYRGFSEEIIRKVIHEQF